MLWGSFARVTAAPDHPIGFDEATLTRSLRWIEDVWGTGKALGALVLAERPDAVT